MTVAGDYFDGMAGQRAANEVTIGILEQFRKHGVRNPMAVGDIHVDGVEPEQIPPIINRLKTEGFVDSASVQKGFVTVVESVISRDGERLLEANDGEDTSEMERDFGIKILKQGEKQKGAFEPCLPEVSESRQAFIVSSLTSCGYLKPAEVQRGFFPGVKAHVLTDSGRALLSAAEAERVRPDPQTDIEVDGPSFSK